MIPRRRKIKKLPVGQSVSIPAPIGGLNARDALAAMPLTDAIKLDNWFPGTTSVNLRRGYEVWSTGLTGDVETLMTWNGPISAIQWAAAAGYFWNVTTQGPTVVDTGPFSSNHWEFVNMGTPGGQFLLTVNDSALDSMYYYDGIVWRAITAVSVPISITGVDTKLFIHINVYKTRVFLIQRDSCKYWYLPVNSIGGAALSVDLAPVFKLGGYLMSMTTWTIDNAAGVVEYLVFISSEGEVVMYNGTDPASATNWAQAGRFRIGRPIGRRCFMRYGSDVLVICEDGLMPLSKALLTDRAQTSSSLTDKITDLISQDMGLYSQNFGWQATLYTAGDKILLNVPTSEGRQQHQYVMNTITGAWCRFTGWNANCFNLKDNDLYFGGNLGATAASACVMRADTGYSDNGAFIFGEVKTSFQYFGMPGYQKQVTMARPIFRLSGNMTITMAMDMDFADAYPVANPTFSGTSGTLWNTSLWNTFPWALGSSVKKDWQGVTGVGDCGALHMRIVNNMSAVEWQSIQYVFKRGGIL